MPEIKDDGKVWIRGQTGTAFAVKVDDRVFVPGQEEGQSIDYWLEGNYLCVDLHDTEKRVRIARRFPLDMEATHPATLFNGFTKTRHADVRVVTFQDEEVQDKVFEGRLYSENRVKEMAREDFWQWAGFRTS